MHRSICRLLNRATASQHASRCILGTSSCSTTAAHVLALVVVKQPHDLAYFILCTLSSLAMAADACIVLGFEMHRRTEVPCGPASR
jgi:hypothetical protein